MRIGHLQCYPCDVCNDSHFHSFDTNRTYVEHNNDVSSFPDAALEALIKVAGYQSDHRGRWVKIRRETQSR